MAEAEPRMTGILPCDVKENVLHPFHSRGSGDAWCAHDRAEASGIQLLDVHQMRFPLGPDAASPGILSKCRRDHCYSHGRPGGGTTQQGRVLGAELAPRYGFLGEKQEVVAAPGLREGSSGSAGAAGARGDEKGQAEEGASATPHQYFH